MNWHFRNIDLYPKNHSPRLDPALFQNPTSEYRGTPFWSWNAKLDPRQLCRQIECFKDMGFGGAHMHARTGLDTEYLSKDFLDAIRICTEKFKQEQMLSWLYDEDRWSSGYAGGVVTTDHSMRMKHLLWTCLPYSEAERKGAETVTRRQRTGNGVLVGRYEVTLEGGRLAAYRRLGEDEKPSGQGRVWYAYLETMPNQSWYNNQGYVDTMKPAAIQKFLEVTHERYLKAVGDYFGSVIPSIFTDEPCLMIKRVFNQADGNSDIFFGFTDDLFTTYAATYGQKLEDYLPELFCDLPGGKASVARYRYHDHTAERFASAFADTCGEWCIDHGIALTGHVLGEETLRTQTAFVSEAMRQYRGFQIPGIDMLCDNREYNTAKQTQSACHQYGRPGMVSELYGVTNWDYTFTGHKGQGDWQAALGVTVRVPHLAWVSMAGEAKRDYPAAIDYHSPWYKEYKLVEDHFSRVNVALTRGQPLVRVGVIHPLESFWLCFGPIEQTQLEREEREQAFADVTHWLIFGLMDFDFICEALLPQQPPQTPVGAKQFGVGQMAYDVVVVPNMRTIRATTLDRLEAFAAAGGKVVFAGEIPSLVDALPSDRCQKLAARCKKIDLTRRQLLAAVEEVREVEIRHADGSPANSILHQIRLDGAARHIFFCNTDRVAPRHGAKIRLKGDWNVTLLDTLTGRTQPLASQRESDATVVIWDFDATGSLLLSLEPGWKSGGAVLGGPKWVEKARLSDPVPVTLSEPNVLLLDQAQWRINDGPWQPREEILRLGNRVRQQLQLPPIAGSIAQPWTDRQAAPVVASVALKFIVQSDVNVDAPILALEEAQATTVTLDGKPVATPAAGWWVDEAIQKMPLPPLAAGTHEIVLTLAFTRKTNMEWAYLLGDFGVEVAGSHAKITAPVRQLAFGNWVNQGLPFYAGNVTYHCQIEGGSELAAIEAPKFSNPLLSVALDGQPAGKIAFAPFRAELGKLSPGMHRLDLTAYGNRVNAFGAVHNADENLVWHGPGAWRQTGENWSYEYQLKRMGLLAAPIVKTAE